MKFNKKIFVFGTCFLLLCGALSTVSAYTYLPGTDLQQATFVDIPGGGKEKYNMNYGSKKATTTRYATFQAVKTEALLGNFACLVNSAKSQVSVVTRISTSKKLSQEHEAQKGNIYFAAVSSSTIEPSNTCDVTLKFSADDLVN
ncbi:MAG: hypothetical protein HFF36_07615 [Coprobacillus sp.]|nr:hypothetical protein [Coprobacillus sp.]